MGLYDYRYRREIPFIGHAQLIRITLCKTDALREEKKQLEDEMAVVVDMTQNLVAENARIAQNQDEYQKHYDEVENEISVREAKSERLAGFIKTLKEQDGVIRDFDENLWGSMVTHVTVGRKKEIVVTFRDGTKIQA